MSHTHNSKLISYNYLTDNITSVHSQVNAVFPILEAEVTSTCSQKTSMAPLIKQHYYGCIYDYGLLSYLSSKQVSAPCGHRWVPGSSASLTSVGTSSFTGCASIGSLSGVAPSSRSPVEPRYVSSSDMPFVLSCGHRSLSGHYLIGHGLARSRIVVGSFSSVSP